MFAELSTQSLIAARGPDAAAFLHSQVTSDVVGLDPLRTQYSGYCSPKGRLLATFLVWRLHDEIVLQLPAELREGIQTRLSKYVLRSKVALTDATPEYRLFGVWGSTVQQALLAFVSRLPAHAHEVVVDGGVYVTRLPLERYVVLAPAAASAALRGALEQHATDQGPQAWTRLDIEAAIPQITPATQEQFIPQMLNLDALGAVSYSKGCYPGQEIVARTRYLGRVKQRLHPVRIAAPDAAAGDSLYSTAFGPDQASGTLVSAVAEGATQSHALAVVQNSAVESDLHWKSPDGPQVSVTPLPYALPD